MWKPQFHHDRPAHTIRCMNECCLACHESVQRMSESRSHYIVANNMPNGCCASRSVRPGVTPRTKVDEGWQKVGAETREWSVGTRSSLSQKAHLGVNFRSRFNLFAAHNQLDWKPMQPKMGYHRRLLPHARNTSRQTFWRTAAIR